MENNENNENTPTPQENENIQSADAGSNASENEALAEPIDASEKPSPKKGAFAWSVRQIVFLTCLLLVTAILLTYTLTAAAWRRAYTEKLLEQQEIINGLRGSASSAAENLQLLDAILDAYSYYADTMDRETMLEAAFKAYVAASGDRYAQYYTEEEYQEIMRSNNAELYGVGIGVISKTFLVEGEDSERLGYYIYDIYDGSSAATAGIRIGDWVYAVQVDGVTKTVSELGYSAAAAAIRGEENTTVTVGIYRPNDNGGEFFERQLTRRYFETKSVHFDVLESDSKVGIVKITSFDLKTPSQFKNAVNELLRQGVQRFVFDVRDNPGGDLRSIKAVMSYFLKEGDLILESINRKGEVVTSYRAEAISYEGDYADCSVAQEELGMYADLNMAVLCNESTASAAEVFTATMQDYGLAPIVGAKTFGKGIMQSTKRIPFGDMVGYIKLTTYAYQTKRGESYHDKGILPDCKVDLNEEAKKQPLLLLPQSMDAQLNTAAQLLLADQ